MKRIYKNNDLIFKVNDDNINEFLFYTINRTNNIKKTKEDVTPNKEIVLEWKELGNLEQGVLIVETSQFTIDDTLSDGRRDLIKKETTNYYIMSEKTEIGGGGSVDLSNFYTKDETYSKSESDYKFQPKGNYLTEHQDISGKLDKSVYDADKPTFALKSEIPNTSNFVTNEELNSKGYLTEHQSLVDYAKKTELPTKTSQLLNDSNFLTQHQSLEGYAKTVDIPTKVSQLSNDSGFLTQHQSLAEYAKKIELPTKTSDLTNDSNFLTQHQSLAEYAKTVEVDKKIEDAIANSGGNIDLTEYAKKTELPTKTSQLLNDSNFLTEHQSLADYPTKFEMNDAIDAAITGGTEVNLSNYYKKNETYSQAQANIKFQEKGNYLTEHQDISGKLDTVVYNSDKTTFALKSEIPNVDNFVTNEELNLKGYLTEHQDISGKLDKSIYDSDKPTFATKDDLNNIKITLDTELSDISENAVQNKVITAEVKKKTESVTLTQSEYDQLPSKNPNTLYIISDAEPIDINNKLDKSVYIKDKLTFVTKDELPTKTSDLLNDSGYIVEQSLVDYAKKSELPTKTSDLTNDSNFLTEHQDITSKLDKGVYEVDKPTFALKSELPNTSNFVTNEALEQKGYLTEHQSLILYAKKSELPTKTSDLTNDSGYVVEQTLVDYAKTIDVDNKLNNYYKKNETYSKEEIDNKNYLTEHQDISNKVNKEEISDMLTKTEASTTYQKVGDYVTNDILNQKGYLTEHQSLEGYAKTVDIPTKTSELYNDSNFLTEHQDISGKLDTVVYNSDKTTFATKDDLNNVSITLDTELSSTSQNAVQNKVITTELNKKTQTRVVTQSEYDQLTPEEKELDILYIISDSAPIQSGVSSVNGKKGDVTITAKELGALTAIPSEYVTVDQLPNIEGKLDTVVYTEDKKTFALKSEIPTLTSQLTNDSNFLTEHQSLADYALKSELPNVDNFVTNEALEQKGYLTQHQDISMKADKTYVDETFAKIVRLTQQEYDQLPTKDNNTLYIIN